MSYKASENRYENAIYKKCGNSGLKLPAISLGLWHNFGGVDSFSTSREMILHAFDKGITHFDLANNYGPPPGSAEINFGKILKSDLQAYRDEMIISSKAGYLMWSGPYGEWGSRKHLISSLNQSLKRMGIDYVDVFYSHRPDPNTPLEETMGALEQIVKSGKAIYVGLSNYSTEDTVKANTILKSLGIKCLIHQPKYSMLERWIEDSLIDLLGNEGIGCIPFSPLAQGLLTNKYLKGIPDDSRIAGQSIFLNNEILSKELLTKINKLNDLALSRDQTLAQMALAWILKDSRITSVLIGASKISQIDDSINATQNCAFSVDELSLIETILN